MKKEELLPLIEALPDGIEVLVLDVQKNFNNQDADNDSSAGFYSEISVGIFKDKKRVPSFAVIEVNPLPDGSDTEIKSRPEAFDKELDEISELYESIKDGLYLLNGYTMPLTERTKQTTALKDLQRLRDISCTHLKAVYEID